MKKRILTIIITLAMAMGMISAAAPTVFADNKANPGTWGEYEEIGGEYKYTYADFSPFVDSDRGTMDNPYVIEFPSQLAGLAALVNAYNGGSNVTLTDAKNNTATATNFYKNSASQYIKLIANLDLIGLEWVPIGADSSTAIDPSNAFKGNFDGNGYTISGMAIGTADAANQECQYAGLFGYMTAGSIKNLSVSGLVNVSYSPSSAGGLVGKASGVTITNCYSTGTVAATTNAGGLLGIASNTTITNCYSACSVSGTNAGSFIGNAGSTITIKDCYRIVGIEAIGTGSDSNGSTQELSQDQMQGSAGATDSSWDYISIIEKYGSLVDALNEWVNNNPSYTPWHIHNGEYPTLGVGETITPNTDGQTHTVTCGCNISTIKEHSGGTATCTEQAECQHCGASYGEVGGHTPDAAGYTVNADGTHSFKCAKCGADVTEAHTFTDGACTGCGVIGGYCGEEGNEQNVIWTYAGGTLTVSGTGAMADPNDPDNRPWEAYADQITTIVVNEGITTIGEFAFCNLQQLTTVNLPDSLTTISKIAFGGCRALKTVNLPVNLKTIEGWAFQVCHALESVTLPEGLTTVDMYAFLECINLKSVSVPASVTTIGEGAFGLSPARITVAEDNLNYSSDEHGVLFDKGKTTLMYCRPNIEVETYTIPSTVTKICQSAFFECKNLITIIIPEGVTTIGESAFSECTALTTVTIPEGVTTIEFNTFSGCTSLTTVTIPAGVTTINQWAFSACTALTTVTIPASVTSIHEDAFDNCNALATVNVPCTWDGSLYTFDESVTVNKVHNWVGGACTVCYAHCDHTDNTHETATDNGDGTHSYTCVCGTIISEEHNTTAQATCLTRAICDRCGEYGTVDPDNHDTSVSYDENGFCTGGCYQPAVDSDSDGYYEISNAGQLFWFAKQVNGGNNVNAVLTTDIVVNSNCFASVKNDLSLVFIDANDPGETYAIGTGIGGTTAGAFYVKTGDGYVIVEASDAYNSRRVEELLEKIRPWTPIGNATYGFSGTFDGNGKTISGLYININDSSATSIGLFGNISDGTVKGLTLSNSFFNGYQDIGGVVGSLNNGTIKNCKSYATVCGAMSIGGIAGDCSSDANNISGCYNMGIVSGGAWVGGIIGGCKNSSVSGCANNGNVIGTSTCVGGIVGQCDNSLVSGCTNNENVSGRGYVGGVVGYNNGSTVKDCYSDNCTVSGRNIVGGIVGYINLNATVSRCYNASDVSGTSQVGGVVGYIQGGSVSDCYNTGNISGTKWVGGVSGHAYDSTCNVSNCYNIGKVSGETEVGGIVGSDSATVSNCYYLADSETDSIDGTTFKTAAQFASGEVAYLLNGDQTKIVWYQICGTGLPAFSGSTVYKATKGCTGAYVNDQNAEPAHTFTADSNGFCAACGSAYQPAVLNGNVYEISSAGQLYWFAQQVNGGNTYINGKLTANIVVNEGTMTSESTTARVWTPIGNETNKYGGNFYGNGKTVSGLYFNNSKVDYVGLFGYANGLIENVGVINSFIKGGDYVGGVVGCNYSNVLKCYNASTVSGNNYVGGIVGSNNYTVRNCFNTGTVSGNNFVGGVVGDNNLHNTVTNCYNTGDVSGTGRVGGVIGINSMGTVTNCYYLNTAEIGGIDGEDATDQAEAKTADQFTSGEVAYLLNGDQSGIVWYQTCGEGLPAYSGNRVYRNQLGGCSEVSYKYEYSNEQKAPVTTHDTTKYTYAEASIVNSITATCGDCRTANWTVTLTAPENAVYNGSFIPATVTGEIPGVKVTVSYNKDPINAGAYTASVTLGDVEASVEYNIAQKVLIPTITGRVTKVYDGTNAVPAGLSIVLEGIVGADNVTASAIYTFDRPDAGTKKVNAECILLSGEKLGNYTLSSSTASADVGEITKAQSHLITAPTAIGGLIYNKQAQPLVTPGTAEFGTIVYSFDCMNWSTSIPTAVNAGSYTVFYKVAGDQNHLDTAPAVITVSVAQREVGIIWGQTVFEFNEQRQVPTATVIGVLPGDVCTVGVQGWGIYGGTYTATARSLSNPNYKLPASGTTCQFTITVDYDKEADKVLDGIGNAIGNAVQEHVVPAITNAFNEMLENLFKMFANLFD